MKTIDTAICNECGEEKLSPYMPAHANYDPNGCCGIFMNIKNGTVVCNECGMELVELVDSLATKPKKITVDFLRSIHWISPQKRPMSHIFSEQELEYFANAINNTLKGLG